MDTVYSVAGTAVGVLLLLSFHWRSRDFDPGVGDILRLTGASGNSTKRNKNKTEVNNIFYSYVSNIHIRIRMYVQFESE